MGGTVIAIPRACFAADGSISVLDLLTWAGFAPARSVSRRLVLQGAVTLDGERIDDLQRRWRGPGVVALAVGAKSATLCASETSA